MSDPWELRRLCNHLTKKYHSMKCPSEQEGDVDRDDCQILGTEQVGVRRPAKREIALRSRVPGSRMYALGTEVGTEPEGGMEPPEGIE